MTTEAIEQQRREIYEIAEAIAPTWERRRADIEEVATPVREWMLRELSPRAGDTVLELAAGVGDTGFDAAAVVGERGRLISTDFSPAMVAAARRRGAERGRGQRRVPGDRRRADRARRRLGRRRPVPVRLHADGRPGAALAETRRVLRPGGRVALAVWGAMERNPFFTIVAISLVQRGHLPPPEPPGPPVFSMAARRAHDGAARAAPGSPPCGPRRCRCASSVPDVEEYLSLVADTAGPLGLALRALPDGRPRAVAPTSRTALARFAVADGYELPGVALCAVAA